MEKRRLGALHLSAARPQLRPCDRPAGTRGGHLVLRELTVDDTGLITPAQIEEELNARGMLTRRGGRWHISTVMNLLDRLGLREAACISPG